MAKMDFSGFQDDKYLVEKVTDVEVLDTRNSNHGMLVSNSQAFSKKDLAVAFSPVAAIAGVCDTALSTISDISKCIALVSIGKQRTKQVIAQANAAIEESRQQTKRVTIQEKEQTNRLIIQCKTDLAKREQEIRELIQKNRLRETELRMNHELFMAQLDNVRKIIQSVIEEKNILMKCFIEVNVEQDNNKNILSTIDNSNAKLVELAKTIMSLQNGVN